MSSSTSSTHLTSSVLFQSYRSLGLVSSSTRPHFKRLGTERFLTQSLGKGWCVYNLEKLKVVLIGGAREEVIRSIASSRDLTFTTCGTEIVVWRRQEEVYRIRYHTAPVYLLYIFGSSLLSVDESQLVCVWDIKALTPATSVKSQMANAVAGVKTENGTTATGKGTKKSKQIFISQHGEIMNSSWKLRPLSEIQFPEDRYITSLLHPDTYINIVIVGFGASPSGTTNNSTTSTTTSIGGVEIWNLEKKKMTYRFNTSKWQTDLYDPAKLLEKALGRNGGSGVASSSLTGNKRSHDGSSSSASSSSTNVTCLEQSPVLGCIAIGLASGMVMLYNIETIQQVEEEGSDDEDDDKKAASKKSVDATLIHAFVHTPAQTSSSLLTSNSSASASSTSSSPITSITFRTDQKAPYMCVTQQYSPHVHIWNVAKKSIHAVLKYAHGLGEVNEMNRNLSLITSTNLCTIHTCLFLPNEPVLLTVANDNSIKLWLFEQEQVDNSIPRLLKERSGHSLHPNLIRFYPGERNQLDILSASADQSLRVFSLQKEELATEFSQGAVDKKSKAFQAETKLTPIHALSYSQSKQSEYPNIITAHAGDSAVYTWRYATKAISQHKLLNTTPGLLASVAKSVCISQCGHFGFVGYSNGRIDSYHMQNGTWKGSYGTQWIDVGTQQANASLQQKDLKSKNINVKRKQAKESAAAAANTSGTQQESTLPHDYGHTSPVTGLCVSADNSQLISTSLDGSMIIWNLRHRQVISRVTFNNPVSRLVYSKESGLAAVALDDLSLRVYDQTRLVRVFHQHTSPITDMTFSSDSRWCVTSSTDCCLRIFDIPSGTMIDFLKFSRPITSLTLSPDNAFLATAHVGSLGIHLWANREHFGTLDNGGAGEMMAQGRKQRKVMKERPIQMDVRERQTGEEEEEEEEDTTRVKIEGEEDQQDEKQDEDSDSDSSDDSDSDDEEDDDESGIPSSKKRRLTSSSSKQTSSTSSLNTDDEFSLITYSRVPRSQWKTLSHLDEIKERNKASTVQQPATPAPFFLTALSSLNNEKDGESVKEKEKKALEEAFGVGSSATTTAANGKTPALGSRAIQSQGRTFRAGIISLLESAKNELKKMIRVDGKNTKGKEGNTNMKSLIMQSYSSVHSYLQALSPSSIDSELHSLGLDALNEKYELQLVLEYFLLSLETGQHFEFVQAMLNRFLKVHGTTILQYPELLKLCLELQQVQQRNWKKLEEAFQANIALVAHLAQIQM